MRLALFEPDIPQNAATLIRLGACLDVPVDIIEPCGFNFGDAGFRRAGLDYLAKAHIARHASWEAFLQSRKDRPAGRLVLLTTRAPLAYTAFAYDNGDTLLLGRESAGVPDHARARADAAVRVPMRADARSLNVAVAGAMVLGEALRQTAGFCA